MKTIKTSAQPSQMNADSHKRLLAYSTAASLGAFFAGQSADAAVVHAQGLAPYPRVLLPPALGASDQADFYLSIEGGSVTNFHLFITSDLTSHPTNKNPSQVIRIPGIVPDTNNPAVVNGQVLSALRNTSGSRGLTNSYCAAFLGGAVIGNNTNSPAPFYQPQIGISYNFGSAFPWVNYINSLFQGGFPNQSLGFRFTSSVDGQQHFGYMDIQLNFVPVTVDTLDPNGNPTTITKKICKSLVINDCVYETTPQASITVPKLLEVTKITNQDGLVTIGFGPNTTVNYDPSAFVVETSPTLGPSASWVTDVNAAVYQLTVPTFKASYSLPGTYQAITQSAPGATSQYWRIKLIGGF
jgi:hypothetical protein